MVALVTAALSVLSILLEMLAQHKLQKEANRADTNVQKFREALSGDNAADVSVLVADQHDRVREALCCDPLGGDNPNEQNPGGPTLPGQ